MPPGCASGILAGGVEDLEVAIAPAAAPHAENPFRILWAIGEGGVFLGTVRCSVLRYGASKRAS